MEAAVLDTIAVVERPPGRKPDPARVELSRWFHALSDHDRLMAKRMLELVSRQAVFGFLAVLDGSRKVDVSGASREYFELRHVHDNETDVLTSERGGVLHELL
jgi:hypothetical protein